MARIAGVNLPNQKRLEIGLTYIYGIGPSTAKRVCSSLGLSPDEKIRDLTDDEVTKLREGMTLAIEPMITVGGPNVVLHDDEWSISTEDGSLSAHFEHTVAVTPDGSRILTATGEIALLP